MTNNCKHCRQPIPQGRLALGYKECVDCSTIEAVSCVDITYHKTGNTIQITDKKTADKINKLSQRSGYGIMRGLRSGKASTESSGSIKKPKNSPKRIIIRHTHEDLTAVLKVAISYMEIDMPIDARNYVEESLDSKKINGIQRRRILEMLALMFPAPDKKVIEQKQEPIDEEIQFAFRNWKNSKIYR